MMNKTPNVIIESPFCYNLIYIYEVPYEDHKNFLKIGKASFYSSGKFDINESNSAILNNAAEKRISSGQTGTGGFQYKLLHTEIAIRKDEKGKLVSFIDDDVHEVLLNSGFHRAKMLTKNNPREWFEVDLQTAKNAIKAVKEGRKSLNNDEITNDFGRVYLYPNQEEAVSKTLKVFKTGNTMLWDAKMRFGKTVTALELVKRLNSNPEIYGNIKKVIIATHRPEVIKQWFEDFRTIFYEKNSTWKFGSKVKGFGLPVEELIKCDNYVCFASLQDLRGAELVGGNFIKNKELYDIKWDLLIIDEAHEGTLTERGESVFRELVDDSKEHKTKVLRLSGTPFNIIDQYDKDEIYSWSYIDEQEAKLNWDYFKNPKNPYAKMPKMNVYTYDLGTILNNPHFLDDKMFNFGEFFRVWTGRKEDDIDDNGSVVTVSEDRIGKFVHEKDVVNFLNLLSKEDEGTNYPFSTNEYRNFFNHTLWMVPGVKEAYALSELLREHPIFKNFKIVNVAGDGDEIEANNEEAIRKTKRALDKVEEAIEKNERTITLSCQRLTTGVTVKEWTAVLMLYGSSQVAAQRYMQTIFRVQSPANFDGKIKDNCYVFEFAPDRALKVLARTAHLSHQAGKVNSPETKLVMERLLKFCPVIAINGSQMNYYDVPMMIKQLKSAYIDDIVDSGFENKRIYNLEQLKLENINLKDFEGCDHIIKGASQNKASRIVKIVENDLDKKEKVTVTIGDKRPKSEEEKKREKEAKNAIRILNAIMTKVPLMVYGLTLDVNKKITYDNFPDLIDPASWEEFMPKDVTKDKFRMFKKYIDIEMFELCNEELRNQVNAANKLSINERIKRLTPLFLKFKNPDKETVLTPWRVVNMHLGDCLGGYNFYNENYQVVLDDPRFINQGQVTNQVLKNTQARILEINSKTGLYPLYVTYSLFRERLNSPLLNKSDRNLWKETIERNIFVVCRTKMAESITKRTLVGDDKNIKVNVITIDNMIEQLRTKPDNVISKILNKTEWNIQEGGKMEFDAIIGNPPYQLNDGGGIGDSATPIYQLFISLSKSINPKYLSMIVPARWMKGGKGLSLFRNQMMNDHSLSKLFDYADAKVCFPNINIDGGICYFLWDQIYNGKVDYTYQDLTGYVSKSKRNLKTDFSDTVIRDVRQVEIIRKAATLEKEKFSTIVSTRNPYGLFADLFNSPEKYTDVHWCSKENNDSVKVYGVKGIKGGAKRITGYINKNAVKKSVGIDKYKLLFGKAYMTTSTTPPDIIIAKPNEVCTETFLQIGPFNSEKECDNCLKYIKSKFYRALLFFNRSSLNISTDTFNLIPLQNFCDKSDIDWSRSIVEIDKQLYKKYNLMQEEIDFIEKTVKPME